MGSFLGVSYNQDSNISGSVGRPMLEIVHVAFEEPTDSHVLASDEDDATSDDS